MNPSCTDGPKRKMAVDHSPREDTDQHLPNLDRSIRFPSTRNDQGPQDLQAGLYSSRPLCIPGRKGMTCSSSFQGQGLPRLFFFLYMEHLLLQWKCN